MHIYSHYSKEKSSSVFKKDKCEYSLSYLFFFYIYVKVFFERKENIFFFAKKK
jgi:hypothetical protein